MKLNIEGREFDFTDPAMINYLDNSISVIGEELTAANMGCLIRHLTSKGTIKKAIGDYGKESIAKCLQETVCKGAKAFAPIKKNVRRDKADLIFTADGEDYYINWTMARKYAAMSGELFGTEAFRVFMEYLCWLGYSRRSGNQEKDKNEKISREEEIKMFNGLLQDELDLTNWTKEIEFDE